MTVPRPDASQKAVLQQLLASDVELQTVARKLVLLGLKEMINVMQRGTPADKVAIAKSLAGVITRPLMEDSGDDVAGELAAEMRQMMQEVRGVWAPDQVEDEEVTIDAPPPRTKGRVVPS